MGRTLRHRSRKGKSSTSLGSDDNFIRLTRWMSRKGWRQSSTLQLAEFSDTGRGLMARHSIQPGNVLVSIPEILLVTSATACYSTVGHILAEHSSSIGSFLCQEVLASFLVWEKHLGSDSVWVNYIATLPISFTVPLSLDKQHLYNFPWFLQEDATNSLELVQKCYKKLTPLFANGKCKHCQLTASEIFTWEDFLWGWCCVNTRAVFIEPNNVPPHTLPLKDRNCLALAPYLDMFNHSDTAEVKVGLNRDNGCYEIITMLPVLKYKEVFINYGPHSNTKLFLEYGFFLPSNMHDSVPVTLNHLKAAWGAAGISIRHEYEKIKFCKKYSLFSQLYISDSGLSWNCSTLLKIFLCSSSDAKVWEQISILSSDDSLVCDTNLSNVIKYIIKALKCDLVQSQNLLQKCDRNCCTQFKNQNSNPTLNICWSLFQNYLLIIEAAVSSSFL